MSVEAAIVTRLGATAGVTALVSTRIFQLKLQQRTTFPAVRVQLISERTNYHLRGGDDLAPARVQIDAFAQEASGADPYASATALGAAIFAALSGQRFTASGLQITGALRVDRRVGYEADELRLVRESQDFMVWAKAA